MITSITTTIHESFLSVTLFCLKLSFRSVRGTIEKKKAALRQILGLPIVSAKGSQDLAMTEMLESIGFYMRKTVDKYDVRPNVQVRQIMRSVEIILVYDE